MRAGFVMAVAGVVMLLAGAAAFVWWLLFMSGSHSYLSPAFQAREAAVLWGGVAGLLIGVVLLVAGMTAAAAPKAEAGEQGRE